jgi:hypothetical protein
MKSKKTNKSANKKMLGAYPACTAADPGRIAPQRSAGAVNTIGTTVGVAHAGNPDVMRKPMEIVNCMMSASDPDGMYTGRPVDGGMPVQDADDN